MSLVDSASNRSFTFHHIFIYSEKNKIKLMLIIQQKAVFLIYLEKALNIFI